MFRGFLIRFPTGSIFLYSCFGARSTNIPCGLLPPAGGVGDAQFGAWGCPSSLSMGPTKAKKTLEIAVKTHVFRDGEPVGSAKSFPTSTGKSLITVSLTYPAVFFSRGHSLWKPRAERCPFPLLGSLFSFCRTSMYRWMFYLYICPFPNRSFYLTAFIPASSPPVRPEQSRHLTALLRSVSESSVVRRRAVQQRQVAPSNLSKARAILNDFP